MTIPAEIPAVLAHMRKVLLLLQRREPLSKEDDLQVRMMEPMLLNVFAHRKKGDMSYEQALEMAKIMQEYRELRLSLGIPAPTDEELLPKAEAILNMARPVEN